MGKKRFSRFLRCDDCGEGSIYRYDNAGELAICPNCHSTRDIGDRIHGDRFYDHMPSLIAYRVRLMNCKTSRVITVCEYQLHMAEKVIIEHLRETTGCEIAKMKCIGCESGKGKRGERGSIISDVPFRNIKFTKENAWK